MERVVEPELMDDAAQAEAYAVADFAEVNEGFVARFAATFPSFERGAILDLGCGPGDIPIRLARRYPDAHITGVDGAKAMLDLGVQSVRDAGLEARVELVHAYLPGYAASRAFDAVVSNSLLHHLHDPTVLWSEIRRLGRPGAAVLVMDLFRPASREAAQSIVDAYAAEERPVLRTDFFNSLLAAFTPVELEAQLSAAGLADALRVEVISDRHVKVAGMLPGR